jgi:hypothetical protein
MQGTPKEDVLGMMDRKMRLTIQDGCAPIMENPALRCGSTCWSLHRRTFVGTFICYDNRQNIVLSRCEEVRMVKVCTRFPAIISRRRQHAARVASRVQMELRLKRSERSGSSWCQADL